MRPSTRYTPSSNWPCVNPTATLAGMPERAGHRRERPRELLAVADPVSPGRPRSRASRGRPGCRCRSVNSLRNQSCSMTMRSKFVARAGRHLGSGLGDLRREVVGKLEEHRVRWVVRGRGPQRLRREPRHRRADRELVTLVEVVVGLDQHRGVSEPGHAAIVGPDRRRDRLRGGRHERAVECLDRHELVVRFRTGRRRAERVAVALELGIGDVPTVAVEPGQRRDPPVRRRASAATVNISVSAWFTMRDRMSTSGLTISVTPPRPLWVSNSGSASAPGRCGCDRPRAGHHERRGAHDTGRDRQQRVAGAPEHGARSPFEAQPQQGEGHESGADHREAACGAVLVDSERGDEHEQDGAGHERLAPRLGAERERVGQPDRGGRRGTGEEGPAGVVDDRRGGRLELVLNHPVVGPDRVPGVGQRKDRRERVRVVDPGDQPRQAQQQQRDGHERRCPQPAQHVGRPVAGDCDEHEVARGSPIRRTPG